MKKLTSAIFFISLVSFSIAQEGTQSESSNEFELITDRPDLTESSVLVPHKYLQIESGYVIESAKTAASNLKSYTYNSTLFRYGLFKNLELRVGLEYLGQTTINNQTEEKLQSGLGPLYTGFKFNLWKEAGWRPELSVLTGIIMPFTANENYKPTSSLKDVKFLLTNTLSDKVSVTYNLGPEWTDGFNLNTFFYSLALGIGLDDKFGLFLEGYGWFYANSPNEHFADAGFTYLARPNLQLDVSFGSALSAAAKPYRFFGFGASYRLPR